MTPKPNRDTPQCLFFRHSSSDCTGRDFALYMALLGLSIEKDTMIVVRSGERVDCFVHCLDSPALCVDRTYNTFGNWRCPLHLMKQQVSIFSSESLNDTKLFPIHLYCVCSMAILKSDTHLSLISPPFSPRNRAYLFPVGRSILSVFHFFP